VTSTVTAIVDEQLGVSSRTMSYDGLNQLLTANDPNVWGNGTYSYDPLGNIRTSVVGTRSSTMGYDSTNKLTGISTNGVNTAYAYNSQGNVSGKGAQSFSFDQGNRLTQATGIASYSYDGSGRRTSETLANGTYRVYAYAHSGQLLYGLQTQSGVSQTTRYIYLGSSAIAETNSAGGTTFLHTDGLGSPVATSNSSAAVLTRTRYEAYGNTSAGTNPDGPGFTGHVNDPSTGLIYMQQRYYDPIASRFLSVDPMVTNASSGESFNRYAYVGNDPLDHVDPTGEATDAMGNFAPAEGDEDSGIHYNPYVVTGAVLAAPIVAVAVAVLSPEATVAAAGSAAAIEKNIAKFTKQFQNRASSIVTKETKDGGSSVTATVDGKVPGSKAVYEKVIGPDGKTISVKKTTVDPAGKVVHVKDKTVEPVKPPEPPPPAPPPKETMVSSVITYGRA
jgi:RHS repeat-associated protein